MNNPTMLYKYPGSYLVDRDKFDYVVLDADDESVFKKALQEGWSKTPTEAKALTEKLVAEEIKPKGKK